MDDADLECIVAAILAAGALSPGAPADFAVFKYRFVLDHLRDTGPIHEGAREAAGHGAAVDRAKHQRAGRMAISDSDYDVFSGE